MVVGTFLLLGLPWLALSLRETAIADPPFYSFSEVNGGGASLNSLPIPFLYHPWLGGLARSIYRGVTWEQSIANLGFLAPVMAIAGAVRPASSEVGVLCWLSRLSSSFYVWA